MERANAGASHAPVKRTRPRMRGGSAHVPAHPAHALTPTARHTSTPARLHAFRNTLKVAHGLSPPATSSSASRSSSGQQPAGEAELQAGKNAPDTSRERSYVRRASFSSRLACSSTTAKCKRASTTRGCAQHGRTAVQQAQRRQNLRQASSSAPPGPTPTHIQRPTRALRHSKISSKCHGARRIN
jgi:hypothetical protein